MVVPAEPVAESTESLAIRANNRMLQIVQFRCACDLQRAAPSGEWRQTHSQRLQSQCRADIQFQNVSANLCIRQFSAATARVCIPAETNSASAWAVECITLLNTVAYNGRSQYSYAICGGHR